MKYLGLGVLGLLLAGSATAKDLIGVYEDALRNDPQLRAADANRLASRESRPQALAALLPQVSGTAAYTRDHSAGTQNEPTATLTGQLYVAEIPYTLGSTEKQWGLNLRQNLFSWQNWITLKQSNSQVAQAEATYAAAEQNLIFRVSQAYFNVLAAQDNLEAQQASLQAIAHQLDQADKRYDVGLIAITDVQEAKAARDTASAAVIAAKRTLASSADQLQEITGEKYDSLSKPGADMPLNMPEPADEQRWVDTSLDQNLSLVSSRLAADIARDNIKVAFGGHLPTVDLVAGRSYTNNNGDEISLGQAFDNVGSRINDRQISLQVTVPIFSGGLTQSKVRQSQYLWIAAKEQVVQTSRATERQARDAYLGVISGIARVQALRQALESSQTALTATEAGYEVGTRTAVDVLNARRTLVQAQTDYSGSRYDFIVSLVQLRLAAGNLDRAQLAQINGWLGVVAPTSPPVETPESLTPKLPPDSTTAPITPNSVLPPPGTPQPAGRQP
ncbi:MAG TPA: TolC family outer membrane protein, partial [Steroidobacteraceae bacterium]